MKTRLTHLLSGLPLFLLLYVAAACGPAEPPAAEPVPTDSVVVRVATINLEDVRTEDLERADHPRLRALAGVIRSLAPDVILINEIAYDGPVETDSGSVKGLNAHRFAERFVNEAPGGLRYRAFMAPTNTGLASGLDLDNSGEAVTTYPPPPGTLPDGSPGPQTPEGRAYGNDAWGFGTFPGQYGMGLLVRDDLVILDDEVRTFRLLPWSRMPDPMLPADPETGAPWFDAEEAEGMRLSSKSHWDVPVRLPNGSVLHVLASHPTPAAFDGPEQRNVRRNRAEIRFWSDYLDGASYIEDDAGRAGGLPAGAYFVIVGDLNADPDEGNALDDPVGTFLLRHPRVAGRFVPTADSAGRAAYPDLDPDDTARWGLRVDYVLPAASLRIVDGGMRRPPSEAGPLSDHFPVWLDLAVPGPFSKAP